MSWRKHALVKDARNQYSAGIPTIENNVEAMLFAPQSRANVITRTTQLGIFSQHLTACFQILEIPYGLICAPGA